MRRLVLFAALFGAVSGSPDEDEAVCPAGRHCTASIGKEYYYPQGRGLPKHFGQSPYTFGGQSVNFSALLKWSWQHPNGRFHTTIVGKPIIDHERNIYLASTDGIRKFSPDGEILWTYEVFNLSRTRQVPNTPAIMDGMLFNCLTTGHVFALSMDTGKMIWEYRATYLGIGGDMSFMTTHNGLVFLDIVDPAPDVKRYNRLLALHGADGSWAFEFTADIGVWNFLPSFPGDGTMLFQQWNGGSYRLNLTTGRPIWQLPPYMEANFTTGGSALGPNGIFYTVKSEATVMDVWKSPGGFLRAQKVSDGTILWERTDFDQGIYTWPVVGRLGKGSALSVVTGVGNMAGLPLKMQCLFAVAPGAVLGVCVAIYILIQEGWKAVKRPCTSLRRMIVWLLGGAALGFLVAWFWFTSTYTSSIQAFDAETGERQWRVELPPHKWFCAAGDEEGLWTRYQLGGIRYMCQSAAMTYPILDADGALYFGHQSGKLFKMKDWNGDGTIDMETEVSTFEAGSTFFSGGPSIAPGMLAAANCDTLYVFQEPTHQTA